MYSAVEARQAVQLVGAVLRAWCTAWVQTVPLGLLASLQVPGIGRLSLYWRHPQRGGPPRLIVRMSLDPDLAVIRRRRSQSSYHAWATANPRAAAQLAARRSARLDAIARIYASTIPNDQDADPTPDP